METRSPQLCLVVCVAALLTTPATAFAQAHEGFGIQLAGGPIFANLTDVSTNTSNKTGWLLGVALGGNRGGALGVEADVLYGQKGATLGGNQDFTQHVVDVPVMLKLNLGSSNVNGLSVFASGGGFFDWQFDRKINDVSITGDTSGYEVGWVAGAGVEVLRFGVQGRYIRGVRQISNTFNIANSNDAKTQAFLVLLTLRLN